MGTASSPEAVIEHNKEELAVERAEFSDTPERHPHVDPVAEKAIVRKMDFRLVPLVTALCTEQWRMTVF
jgi:hypothetical protein